MKHDQFHTNNSNIYIISYAYKILSTHLIQNQNKHRNRYRKKSYIIQQIKYQKYLNTKDDMFKTKLKGM